MAAPAEGKKHMRVSFLVNVCWTSKCMSEEAGWFLPGGQRSPAGTHPLYSWTRSRKPRAWLHSVRLLNPFGRGTSQARGGRGISAQVLTKNLEIYNVASV